MAKDSIAYLVFDLESVADGPLVARLRYPGSRLGPSAAVRRYRKELAEKHGSDFVPYTFQIPVALVVAKVARDFRLIELASLDEPDLRPHVITEHFWRGWEKYGRPTLVSFNGRSFDIPVLELAAFRYGIEVPRWFHAGGKAFEQPRNRYNQAAHIDLLDLLTNYGASRFTGGLDLAANLLGKPGKMDIQGHMVQEMHDKGKRQEISDYCCCDVLDTYFVFLRTRVLRGEIDLKQEQTLVSQARSWIEKEARSHDGLARYLENWGDWENPWTEAKASAPRRGRKKR